jgi:hypothetical protein
MPVEQLCQPFCPPAASRSARTRSSSHWSRRMSETLLSFGALTAGVEDTGSRDALHTLPRPGARLQPLPVDQSSVVPGAPFAASNGSTGPRATTTHQRHHYPSKELPATANDPDTWVIEDDDDEFRSPGSPTPALKAARWRAGERATSARSRKFLTPGCGDPPCKPPTTRPQPVGSACSGVDAGATVAVSSL